MGNTDDPVPDGCPLGRARQTRNLVLFAACTALQYFAAPVSYVGITQASLCHELGSSDAVANLPETAYLSVNCSHRTVAIADLVPLLVADAKRLVVEITEHEPVDDYDQLASSLQPLRDLGVRIAIDDAGAGYASLRHTLALGPDIVKVDISLTRSIDMDRGRRALASALISFADEMDMTIIAEGIETEAELTTLLDLGVRYGQGYHLAEPAALEERRGRI